MDLLVYGTDLSFLNLGHVFEKQGKSGQKQYYAHLVYGTDLSFLNVGRV